MNRDEVLQELANHINQGEISREEIIDWLSEGKTSEPKAAMNFSLTKIFYVLGAAIVAIGVSVFVATLWDGLGPIGRIGATLLLSMLFAVLGSSLFQSKPESQLGPVFHAIGGAVMPGGMYVLLNELSIRGNWTMTFAMLLLAVFYGILAKVHKHAILTFFMIANATSVLYLALDAVFDFSSIDTLVAYLTLLIGVSYFFISMAVKDTWNDSLRGALNFFGSNFTLGAAFYLMTESSAIWELFYFPLLLVGFFASVYLKSRSALVMSTIFLVAYVSYITSEYFVDSIGWPLALVLLGFLFIALGYMSVQINQKYIQK